MYCRSETQYGRNSCIALPICGWYPVFWSTTKRDSFISIYRSRACQLARCCCFALLLLLLAAAICDSVIELTSKEQELFRTPWSTVSNAIQGKARPARWDMASRPRFTTSRIASLFFPPPLSLSRVLATGTQILGSGTCPWLLRWRSCSRRIGYWAVWRRFAPIWIPQIACSCLWPLLFD